MTNSITGGRAKLQWKPDWAMRWVALGIDYEMAGKDLIDSVKLSGEICRALGGAPPEGFNYELFLDEKGQKISKSKGNGLTLEEWLRYASAEQIQDVVYEIGRREPFLDHKQKTKDGKPGVSLGWFNMLYQVLLGQEKGPRFGSFVAVYGLANAIEMIDGALATSA